MAHWRGDCAHQMAPWRGDCGVRGFKAGARYPVSKMTVNFCLGVPMPTSIKYCVPFLFTTGMRSTCPRRHAPTNKFT